MDIEKISNIYNNFINKKREIDSFFNLKIVNYELYIKAYFMNKEEFVNKFFNHIDSILKYIFSALKLLEEDYYSFYSDYILDEGYSVSLFQGILEQFRNLKKY